jgi:hypothetical protein
MRIEQQISSALLVDQRRSYIINVNLIHVFFIAISSDALHELVLKFILM